MTSLEAYLSQSNAAYLDDCTRCGKCVEVCPVTPVAGIDASRSAEIVGSVVDLFDDGPALDGDAKVWAHQCNGCGLCIPECPENINPRRMIMLANTAESRQGSETPQLFRKMARAIRIMAAMQLAPPEFQKLLRNPRARTVPVVFYLGCNPIRTPHLLFNAMTILDALEIDYETVGGPGACCGIIHAKWEGEIEKGGRISDGTLHRFEEFTPEPCAELVPVLRAASGRDHRRVPRYQLQFSTTSRNSWSIGRPNCATGSYGRSRAGCCCTFMTGCRRSAGTSPNCWPEYPA